MKSAASFRKATVLTTMMLLTLVGIIPTAEARIPTLTAGVNAAPVLRGDRARTEPGSSVFINVIANDAPGPESERKEGQRVRLRSIVMPPRHGLARVATTTKVLYSPDGSASGIVDHFSYRACDTGKPSRCSRALVAVRIGPFVEIDDDSVIEGATASLQVELFSPVRV